MTPQTPDDFNTLMQGTQSADAPEQQPAQPQQPVAQPSQGQQPPQPQPATYSNAPSAIPNDAHPAVQKAGLLHSIAATLAGGDREVTTVDAQTGAVTRTPRPLTTKQIGLALAFEALSGGIAGLAQKGPGATGAAAAAGFQQGVQQRQTEQQQQEQQAQADAASQSKAFAQAAAVAHTNSQTLLNTSEVEQRGADAIDKLVAINRASGVLDVDPEVEDGGQPITQAELIQGMKDGQYNSTSHLGPIAGRVQVTNPDGSSRWEATHLILKDPATMVPVSQSQWDAYANAGIPGYRKGASIGAGTLLKLSLVQNANEQLAGRSLANDRLADLRTTLQGTPEAEKVPASVDYSKPGVNQALTRFQKYVSHNASNLADPYAALQAMGADKRNADGTLQPNPDAKFVDAVAQSFGGWPVLEAAHNQLAANKQNAEKFAVIDSSDKALAVKAAPKRFTSEQVSAATNFLALSQQQGETKTADEARQRAIATGADVEAMYKFGVNPITKEKLSLDNAPDSMLVTPSGLPVPQNQQPLWKPSAQEKQTADTARQVLQIAQGLRQVIQQNPNLAGPLSGRSKQGLAKLGLGDAQAQKYLDDLSFLQTASVKMHTGRFSNEILKKMDTLIQPGMNVQQFTGALDSIQGVAGRYADEDKLTTVADYKTQQAQTSNSNAAASAAAAGVPPGATAARDANGRVVGYKTQSGQYVSLGGK